jgi:exopolysaccharide biosynthesis polyprenyl glycosylphosphotransferase
VLPLATGPCLVALDVGLVLAAFLLAYWVRFVAPDDQGSALGLEEYIHAGLIIGVVSAALFAMRGLYDGDRRQAWAARGYTILSAFSTALVLVVAASYFVGDQPFSRVWFATGWAFAVVGLVAWRTVAAWLYPRLREALMPANRVIVVGANPLGRQLADELADNFEVVGYVDNGSDLDPDDTLPLLGPISELASIVQAYGAHEIVIALPQHRQEQVSRLIARGFHTRVKVKFLPDLGDLLPQRFEVQHVAGRRYIDFAPAAAVSGLKRIVDLALVGVALWVIWPLFVMIALAIKVESAGPVLYRQRRVGKNGRHFWMLKFRSMHEDAEHQLDELREQNEAVGPLFKIKADPRVTRVGRVLRRWSLDELPQVFNVLRGDMSLVGPRPPIPSEVAQYEDWELGRLRAVPGLTGLWQVSGRSQVPFHDMVRLDLHYIRNWSLGLDFEILLRTIPAVVTNRGAY